MKVKLLNVLVPVTCMALLCSCGNAAESAGNNDKEKNVKTNEPAVEIAVKDYLHMEVEGYDTVGKLKTYGIDTVKIAEDNKKAFKIPEDDTNDTALTVAVNCLNSYLEPKTDKYELLSNGDVVVFQFNANYNDIKSLYNVDINIENAELTVSGLNPLKEIDPFDYVECQFLHLPAELGENLINALVTDNTIGDSQIKCKIDKDVVKSGEKVTVEYYTISDQYTLEQLFAMQGYKPTRLSKEYIAE